VSVKGFTNQLKRAKRFMPKTNKDRIITIFAWNEWAEGAVLENSKEFGNDFIEVLSKV